MATYDAETVTLLTAWGLNQMRAVLKPMLASSLYLRQSSSLVKSLNRIFLFSEGRLLVVIDVLCF